MKKLFSFAFLASLPASLWACGAGMDCGMHGGSSGHAPVYLALLGFGYWLLSQAERETKKNMKTFGRTVSAIVLLASLFGLLCPVLFRCASHEGAMCAHGPAKASACPFMGSSTVAPSASVVAPAEPELSDKKK